MDFKKATDSLFSRIDHENLARALGVSVALIRQARLRDDASAHRSPPPGWKTAVISLAEEKAELFRQLADSIRYESRNSDLSPKNYDKS